jgi:hypothetical protein
MVHLLAAIMLIVSDPTSPAELADLFRLAGAISLLGVAAVSVGLVRSVSMAPESEQPAVWLCLALAAFGGVVVLIGAPSAFAWPSWYQPTDPRSQPGTVLGAFLFFFGGGAVAFTTGLVMFVMRLRAPRPSGDIH